jgi:predicted MPP superfamily phosphohydrolase
VLHLVFNHLPEVAFFAVVILVQALGLRMLLHSRQARSSNALRSSLYLVSFASLCLLVAGFLARFSRVTAHVPVHVATWTREGGITWAVLSIFLVLTIALSKLIPSPRLDHSPSRRRFLNVIRTATLAAPTAALGYGVYIARSHLDLREESIAIPGLHPDLDGLRIAQLTDIHLSPFLSVAELERAVAMANETRPHLTLVTGDLISTAGDPLDACLDRLSKLRTDAGIFGCLGNHEIYAGTEDYTTEQGARLGMRFLRSAAQPLRFGNATLNLAGTDYQRMHGVYLVGTEKLIAPGALNVLMSHNPDVFPVAERQGWDFTISGHTHGGQINVEILRHDISVARFFTPYTVGQYRIRNSSIYVSRGIGTIGIPVRLGAPPEVALLRLCRT